MLKFFVIFIYLISSFDSFSASIEIRWSNTFDKSLYVDCHDNKYCEKYFFYGMSIEEEICDNCFSNDAEMSFLFNSIGKELSVGDEVHAREFYHFLFMGQFVSIDYNSPYDLVTNSSTIVKKLKFRKLCESYTQEPIIFYAKTYFNQISKPKYVFCGEKVFRAEIFMLNEGIDVD